eukprot:1811717-Pyramimonas_sp.AAC.1
MRRRPRPPPRALPLACRGQPQSRSSCRRRPPRQSSPAAHWEHCQCNPLFRRTRQTPRPQQAPDKRVVSRAAIESSALD